MSESTTPANPIDAKTPAPATTPATEPKPTSPVPIYPATSSPTPSSPAPPAGNEGPNGKESPAEKPDELEILQKRISNAIPEVAQGAKRVSSAIARIALPLLDTTIDKMNKVTSGRKGDGEKDIETGTADAVEEREYTEEESSKAHSMFFLKVFGVLSLNFIISLIIVYVLVAKNVFSESKTFLVIVFSLLLIASYALLVYLRVVSSPMLAVRITLLYVFIASASVLLAVFAARTGYWGGIFMYALVSSAFALIFMLLFSAVSGRFMMQDNRMWYFSVFGIGAAISLIYLLIVSFSGKSPFGLPPVVESAIRSYILGPRTKNKSLAKFIVFLLSGLLSLGLISLVLLLASKFIKSNGVEVLHDKKQWTVLVVSVYVYMTIPLGIFAYVILVLLSCCCVLAKSDDSEEEADPAGSSLQIEVEPKPNDE